CRGRQEVPKRAVHLVAGQPFPILVVVRIQGPIVPDGPPLIIHADQGGWPSVFDDIDDRDDVYCGARECRESRALLPEQILEGLLRQRGDVVSEHHKVAVAEGHGRRFLALTCAQSCMVRAALALCPDAARTMRCMPSRALTERTAPAGRPPAGLQRPW